MLLAECLQNPIVFFANSLNKALAGEINHKTLTRIIATRSEIDLADIKTAYESAYNQKLGNEVKVNNFGFFFIAWLLTIRLLF